MKKGEKVISAPDLSLINEQHANKWVAFSSDYKKIVAVGDNLADVSGDSRVVMKVLPKLGYAPVVI